MIQGFQKLNVNGFRLLTLVYEETQVKYRNRIIYGNKM